MNTKKPHGPPSFETTSWAEAKKFLRARKKPVKIVIGHSNTTDHTKFFSVAGIVPGNNNNELMVIRVGLADHDYPTERCVINQKKFTFLKTKS